MIEAVHSPESIFLEALFLQFKEADVDYAVMRNYDLLPLSTGGSDLDILVNPKQESLARDSISKAIREAGGTVIGCAKTVGFFKVFAFGRAKNEGEEWWGVRLDISVGMWYAGVARIIGDSALIDQTRLYNGVPVLSPELAAVLGVVKELLHHDLLPERYITTAALAAKGNWNSVCMALAPMGEDALELLRELCLFSPEDPLLKDKSRALRKTLIKKAYSDSLLTYFKQMVTHRWSKLERFINPPGKVIAILGVDGAGKSTVISVISPVLERATHGALVIQHLRPGLLPQLSRFKGEGVQQGGVVTDPHSSTPSGVIGSTVRLVYLLTDYLLGYWTKVRPHIAKSPTIFLFDRYVYDLVIDPKRLRIGLPGWLVQKFIWVVPKPDLIICLHGDPRLIATRKNELPVEEVQRQVQALLNFEKHEPRAVLVSTESSVGETRDEVLSIIRRYCEEE